MTQLLILKFIAGYVTSLMAETFTSMEDLAKTAAPNQQPVLPAVPPPPLCSDFVHPEKNEAVQQFKSRFRRKETAV